MCDSISVRTIKYTYIISGVLLSRNNHVLEFDTQYIVY